MFSYLAREVTARNKRVLILAHRQELLEQIGSTLAQFGIEHGFIAPMRTYYRLYKTQVASVISAARRAERGDLSEPDIIIIDEAHHVVAGSMFHRVIGRFPRAKIIGVTATPCRLSGEALGEIFDRLILGPSVRELISQKYLCDFKIYAPPGITTAGLHTRAGDYVREELSALIDKPSITGNAINEYKKLADGKRAVVFCVSVDHATNVATQFKEAGYRASAIHGSMSRANRAELIDNFKSGKTQIVTSCDILGEGFDLPAIECAIMLRPTKSLALWIQQSGRALRPSPGKELAVILDHAGNTLRHGFPDEERDWSLDGGLRKRARVANEVQVKICLHCFAAQKPGPGACVYCGEAFAIKLRKVETKSGDLVELDRQHAKINRLREQGSARSLEALTQLGIKRGYKNPVAWARHLFYARMTKKNG